MIWIIFYYMIKNASSSIYNWTGWYGVNYIYVIDILCYSVFYGVCGNSIILFANIISNKLQNYFDFRFYYYYAVCYNNNIVLISIWM